MKFPALAVRIVKKHNILLILLLPFIILGFNKYVFAATSDYIDATIKMSVCGDGIIEGPEDCEGHDLNNQTCATLGYEKGNLKCDSACEFDTSRCQPFPEPPPSQDPDPESESKSDSNSSSNSNSSSENNRGSDSTTIRENLRNEIARNAANVLNRLRSLPAPLLEVDQNKDGKIEVNEIEDVVRVWVQTWREFLAENSNRDCDVNEDGVCDLKDFSIVLYYVE